MNLICQFDFLQCFDTLYRTEFSDDCYPSFAAYTKTRIEPIIDTIITSTKDRKWTKHKDEHEIARIIDRLDRFAKNEFALISGWEYKSWESVKISDFMNLYL